jgi:hypothetical protein
MVPDKFAPRASLFGVVGGAKAQLSRMFREDLALSGQIYPTLRDSGTRFARVNLHVLEHQL